MSIYSTKCKDRRGCLCTFERNVRAFVGCGGFRGRRGEGFQGSPFLSTGFCCGRRASNVCYPVKREVRELSSTEQVASGNFIRAVSECETHGYGNYPLEYQYREDQSREVIRMGRHLEGVGRERHRGLLSSRNLGCHDRQPRSIRTMFKGLGGGGRFGEFRLHKLGGIRVRFNLLTVTRGLTGMTS